jgi:hypothetical protein
MMKMEVVLQQSVEQAQEVVEKLSAPFQPHRLVRGARVQTFASSYAPRTLGKMLTGEQIVVLDAGEDATGYDAGVRLFGYYNRQRALSTSRGLVICLHGWEGSSHSTHSLTLGSRLLAEGYNLFRLNLRDHGPAWHINPYALNRGLFLGTLLEESHCAVQRVAAWAKELPVFLVGPSMGGNFVLRMAARHIHHPIANLQRVVAISPAINPGKSTDRIDEQYTFRRYFRQRWLRSVLTKARLFPDLYNFDALRAIPKLRAMTEWLIERYTELAGADDYFSRYAVMGDALTEVKVPTTILTAADDPVIDVEDFATLTPSPSLDIKIERFGGHVGFIDLWPLRHLLPEMVLAELRK